MTTFEIRENGTSSFFLSEEGNEPRWEVAIALSGRPDQTEWVAFEHPVGGVEGPKQFSGFGFPCRGAALLKAVDLVDARIKSGLT